MSGAIGRLAVWTDGKARVVVATGFNHSSRGSFWFLLADDEGKMIDTLAVDCKLGPEPLGYITRPMGPTPADGFPPVRS